MHNSYFFLKIAVLICTLIMKFIFSMTKMKRQLPVLFTRRFSNSMCEKIKQILYRIVQREWMVFFLIHLVNRLLNIWKKELIPVDLCIDLFLPNNEYEQKNK